jgi:glycosyltransferase involved in cell wall biosynthesis
VNQVDTDFLPRRAKTLPPDAAEKAIRTVYADLIGQTGTIIDQLLNNPPEGYRFVTRKKMTTVIASRMHGNGGYRKAKRSIQRFLPANLMTSYFLTRFMKPPVPVDLTYSISTVIFRPEPWVLYVEAPNQLAGFNHHGLRRFKGVLEKALGSPYCRAIICQSAAAKNTLMNRLNTEPFAGKFHVVHCGWAPKPLVKSRSQSEGSVRILFVGASTMAFGFSIKGGMESLEAFKILRQRYPQAELIMRCDVCPDIEREFRGVPGLRIVGEQIPKADLEMLFQSADIYWYPAHSLMSISVLEAMSHGLPVVTTNYYDNAEYVEDGRTGMIVPHRRNVPPWDTSELEVRRALEVSDPEFVQALVEKTAALIENQDLRRRMGRAARADVETKFSLAEKNRKFKNIFDRAVEPQGL